MMKKKTHNFTLIELMVVIAIILIIVGLSTGVFTRVVIGSSVERASRMVSSQLSLARAEAVAKRRQVAIIMPGTTSFDDSDALQPYRYRSMRAAYVTGTSPSFVFDEWVPGTQWIFLPNGALIAHSDSGISEELTPAYSVTVTDYEPTGTCTVDDSASSHTPTATVTNVEVEYEYIDSSDNDKLKNKAVSPNPTLRAIVFDKDGSCNAQTFVTIMEGVMQQGQDTPVNTQPSNINVLEVNRLTGKIRFLFH